VKLLAIIGGSTAIVGAIVAALSLTDDVRPIRPGSEAPDFRAVRLTDSDTVSLADYDGDVILLNLWATWCAPCEVEMPSMQRLHEQLGPRGLKIVAVSVDTQESALVAQWVNDRGLTFDVLHDRRGNIMLDYQATGWPESFIIDSDGIIVRKIWGPAEWDDPDEVAVFLRLLGLQENGGDE
jgi:peroxiredoxin